MTAFIADETDEADASDVPLSAGRFHEVFERRLTAPGDSALTMSICYCPTDTYYVILTIDQKIPRDEVPYQ